MNRYVEARLRWLIVRLLPATLNEIVEALPLSVTWSDSDITRALCGLRDEGQIRVMNGKWYTREQYYGTGVRKAADGIRSKVR